MFDRDVWKKRLWGMLSLDSHPAHIAAGFAAGVFISFTPFFGIHTILAIAVAFLLRINKITCITGSLVNTPLTIAPALGISYTIGRTLRGLPPQELHIRGLQWQYLKGHAASLVIGSSIVGFVAAVFAYFLCYSLVVRFRQRDEAAAELTGDMVETGERFDP